MRDSVVEIFEKNLVEFEFDLGELAVLDELRLRKIITREQLVKIQSKLQANQKILAFIETLPNLYEDAKKTVLDVIKKQHEPLFLQLRNALDQEEKMEKAIRKGLGNESLVGVNWEEIVSDARDGDIIPEEYLTLTSVPEDRFAERKVQEKRIRAFVKMMSLLPDDQKRKSLVLFLAERHPEAGRALASLLADSGIQRTSIVFEAAVGATGGKVELSLLELPGSGLASKNTRNEEYYTSLLSEIMLPTEGILEDMRVNAVDGPTVHSKFNPETTYSCFSKPKGLVLVLNNRKFKTLKERTGTNVDATNIRKLFELLGYKVKVKQNLEAREMKLALDRFILKSDHLKCDSAVVVILSHGKDGAIYGCDEKLLPISDLVSVLQNCEDLRNKPKLFFIQACRGRMCDAGLEQTDGTEAPTAQTVVKRLREQEVADVAQLRDRIPSAADTLLAYATTPGFVSWRNQEKGSWFIQAICQVFAENAATLDIQTMLTRVNNVVAKSFASSDDGFKQVPDPSNRLLKDFYFFPGHNQ